LAILFPEGSKRQWYFAYWNVYCKRLYVTLICGLSAPILAPKKKYFVYIMQFNF